MNSADSFTEPLGERYSDDSGALDRKTVTIIKGKSYAEDLDESQIIILIMNEYSVLKSEINTLEAIPHY